MVHIFIYTSGIWIVNKNKKTNEGKYFQIHTCFYICKDFLRQLKESNRIQHKFRTNKFAIVAILSELLFANTFPAVKVSKVIVENLLHVVAKDQIKMDTKKKVIKEAISR